MCRCTRENNRVKVSVWLAPAPHCLECDITISSQTAAELIRFDLQQTICFFFLKKKIRGRLHIRSYRSVWLGENRKKKKRTQWKWAEWRKRRKCDL